MKRVLFICVNYQTSEMCSALIEGVFRDAPHGSVDVRVVDNTVVPAAENPLMDLSAKYENYRYLKPAQNLGYFGAAQFALKDSSERLVEYDWVIVSNVDISIANKDFWVSLLATPQDPSVGVLAPSIYSLLMRRESNPFLPVRPGRMRMHFYKWVFSNLTTSRAYHFLALMKAAFNAAISSFRSGEAVTPRPSSSAYAPHGAFMVFSRAYFARGGDFFHDAFMYGEEITVAENCRRLGLRVVFEPKLRIIHQERVSTGVIYNRQVLEWKKESSRYAADTYFP